MLFPNFTWRDSPLCVLRRYIHTSRHEILSTLNLPPLISVSRTLAINFRLYFPQRFYRECGVDSILSSGWHFLGHGITRDPHY